MYKANPYLVELRTKYIHSDILDKVYNGLDTLKITNK